MFSFVRPSKISPMDASFKNIDLLFPIIIANNYIMNLNDQIFLILKVSVCLLWQDTLSITLYNIYRH